MTIDLKAYLQNIVLQHRKKSTIALVAADEEYSLASISMARKEGVADALLIGNKSNIREQLLKLDDDISNYEVVDESDMGSCSKKAIDAIAENRADVLMKGLVDSSVLLSTMLRYGREIGVCERGFISHLAMVSIPNINKLCFITDCGVNIAPNLDDKKAIIENAVSCATDLDFENIKVACLCAKEKVSPKMSATVDAMALHNMNKNGEIKGCLVSEPLAFDNIISKEAARIKGIDDPVAGNADIILVPNIETGNALLKSMIYVSNAQMAGVIAGIGVPTIFSSRADDRDTKVSSIYMALALANKK